MLWYHSGVEGKCQNAGHFHEVDLSVIHLGLADAMYRLNLLDNNRSK